MILVIDDEPVRLHPWLEALRRAFGDEVTSLTSANEALRFLQQPPVAVRLLIWDLMLPTAGGLSDPETEFGTRTGLPLYRRFREQYPMTPAILLTNVRDDRLLAQFAAGPHDRAARKPYTMPDQLVDLARELGVTRADEPGEPVG